MNEDGFMFLVDRMKDVFKYNGLHVNPSEIENVIRNMEGVELVSVVGIPDPHWVNLPAAVIKVKEGFEKLNPKDVIELVATEMPEYKQLHGGVFFLDEFPMTASGKIIRREVTQIAIKLYNERKKISE